jgi:AcrR family transcriptional regulator
MPRSRRGAGVDRSASTKKRIVEAGLETLKRDGFAGATSRAIASTGGFNQALIFYHFGTVNQLLLACLDETSARRMASYRAATEQARDLPALLAVARDIYREDLESGHVKVLAELIAGSSAFPELGPEIIARVQPWIRFTEETIARALGSSPIAALVSPSDLAHAVVAFYLGIELLSHLDGDRARADRLFEVAGAGAAMLAALLGDAERDG